MWLQLQVVLIPIHKTDLLVLQLNKVEILIGLGQKLNKRKFHYSLEFLLEDTKLSKDYIYNYRNKPGSYKGTPFNTAGWTSVEIAGKIIDKIGPILATKY